MLCHGARRRHQSARIKQRRRTMSRSIYYSTLGEIAIQTGGAFANVPCRRHPLPPPWAPARRTASDPPHGPLPVESPAAPGAGHIVSAPARCSSGQLLFSLRHRSDGSGSASVGAGEPSTSHRRCRWMVVCSCSCSLQRHVLSLRAFLPCVDSE
jgi:hypothetical protein